MENNAGESARIYIGYQDTKGRLMQNSWSVVTWCHQCVSPKRRKVCYPLTDTFTEMCIGDS